MKKLKLTPWLYPTARQKLNLRKLVTFTTAVELPNPLMVIAGFNFNVHRSHVNVVLHITSRWLSLIARFVSLPGLMAQIDLSCVYEP